MVAFADGAGRLSHICDDAIPRSLQREQSQDSVSMPVQMDGGWSLYAREMKVGQGPVAEKCAAVKLLVEFVPYYAVSTIGAD